MTNAVTTTSSRTMLEPKTFDEAMRFAGMLAKSTMIPRDYQGKPENVLVAIQWGREVGLGPLQALQNVAVINGRPSMWGDAMMALVRGSGQCAAVVERTEGEGDKMVATCAVRRKDDPNEVVATFSVDDAKKAGLWGKSGPWQQYPRRMLQLRARGFALRDAFPDVLRGIVSAEEAQDIPVPPAQRVEPGPVIDAVAEPAPPEDMQRKGADRLLARIASIATDDEMHDYVTDARVLPWLARLKDQRPELFAEIKAAEAEANARLAVARGDGELPKEVE